jgi:hypothetical protein
MKSYRNAAAALTLAVVFSTPAFAGEMHTDGSPTPSPTTNGEMQTGATDGEIHTGAVDSLTQTALDVLAVLPSLP